MLSANDGLPAISVIVPTFDRPERLSRCLAALADLQYPSDRFEVLVVNDGGREPFAPAIASALAASTRLVHQAHAGPAAARNAGASLARFPLLAFLDDDCLPQRDWLGAIARRHARRPDAAISGRTINAVNRNRYATTSQLLVDYLSDYYRHPVSGARFATSSNLAFPAEAFRRMGGFDTRFPRAGGEDRELCDRWVSGGGAIEYADDAIVDHYHPMSFGGFWRQHVNYGRGAYGFRQARRRRLAEPVQIEPLWFYLGLVRRPWREHPDRPSLTALTVVSQVANAAGFVAEAWSARARVADQRGAA
jgi:GT2 family glycosyltransferase